MTNNIEKEEDARKPKPKMKSKAKTPLNTQPDKPSTRLKFDWLELGAIVEDDLNKRNSISPTIVNRVVTKRVTAIINKNLGAFEKN